MDVENLILMRVISILFILLVCPISLLRAESSTKNHVVRPQQAKVNIDFKSINKKFGGTSRSFSADAERDNKPNSVGNRADSSSGQPEVCVAVNGKYRIDYAAPSAWNSQWQKMKSDTDLADSKIERAVNAKEENKALASLVYNKAVTLFFLKRYEEAAKHLQNAFTLNSGIEDCVVPSKNSKTTAKELHNYLSDNVKNSGFSSRQPDGILNTAGLVSAMAPSGETIPMQRIGGQQQQPFRQNVGYSPYSSPYAQQSPMQQQQPSIPQLSTAQQPIIQSGGGMMGGGYIPMYQPYSGYAPSPQSSTTPTTPIAPTPTVFTCSGTACTSCVSSSCTISCSGSGCQSQVACTGSSCTNYCTAGSTTANCTIACSGSGCLVTGSITPAPTAPAAEVKTCTGANCASDCSGVDCTIACTGTGCKTQGTCTGTNCSNQCLSGSTSVTCDMKCTGSACSVNTSGTCVGSSCVSACIGADCSITCTGSGCVSAGSCSGTSCSKTCSAGSSPSTCSISCTGAGCAMSGGGVPAPIPPVDTKTCSGLGCQSYCLASGSTSNCTMACTGSGCACTAIGCSPTSCSSTSLAATATKPCFTYCKTADCALSCSTTSAQCNVVNQTVYDGINLGAGATACNVYNTTPEYESQLASMKTKLSSDPTNADYLFCRGFSNIMLGNYTQANLDFDSAKTYDPSTYSMNRIDPKFSDAIVSHYNSKLIGGDADAQVMADSYGQTDSEALRDALIDRNSQIDANSTTFFGAPTSSSLSEHPELTYANPNQTNYLNTLKGIADTDQALQTFVKGSTVDATQKAALESELNQLDATLQQ